MSSQATKTIAANINTSGELENPTPLSAHQVNVASGNSTVRRGIHTLNLKKEEAVYKPKLSQNPNIPQTRQKWRSNRDGSQSTITSRRKALVNPEPSRVTSPTRQRLAKGGIDTSTGLTHKESRHSLVQTLIRRHEQRAKQARGATRKGATGPKPPLPPKPPHLSLKFTASRHKK